MTSSPRLTNPTSKQGLLVQANAKASSLTRLRRPIVKQPARHAPPDTLTASQAKNLVELFETAPFKGPQY